MENDNNIKEEVTLATPEDWKNLDSSTHFGLITALACIKNEMKSLVIPTHPSTIGGLMYEKINTVYNDSFLYPNIKDTLHPFTKEYCIHIEEHATSSEKVEITLIVSIQFDNKVFAKKLTVVQELKSMDISNNCHDLNYLKSRHKDLIIPVNGSPQNTNTAITKSEEPKQEQPKKFRVGKKRNYDSLSKEEIDDISSMIVNDHATDEELVDKYNLHHFTIKKFRSKLFNVTSLGSLQQPQEQPDIKSERETSWEAVSQHVKVKIIDGLIKLSARKLLDQPAVIDEFADYYNVTIEVVEKAIKSNETLIKLKSSKLLHQVSYDVKSTILQLPYEKIDKPSTQPEDTTLTSDDLKKLADHFNNNN